jgi:formylglycine-generating enzyme required for sulfatase activity
MPLERRKDSVKKNNVEPDLINSIGMKFKLIPAGWFLMGQKDIAEPVHEVKITRPYYMGMHPITQHEWETIMGDNPSDIIRDDLPVVNISWNDCQEFIQKLNEKEFSQEKESYKYRLPTEAEWEYACRAGSKSMFYFNHKEENQNNYIWHFKNSEVTQEVYINKGVFEKKLVKISKSGRMIHPVGQLKPNKFGLFDMHGNVYEWCEDWYGDYVKDKLTDPIGSPKGIKVRSKIFRGGSCKNFAGYGASAHRDCRMPSYRSEVVGARLVREL